MCMRLKSSAVGGTTNCSIWIVSFRSTEWSVCCWSCIGGRAVVVHLNFWQAPCSLTQILMNRHWSHCCFKDHCSYLHVLIYLCHCAIANFPLSWRTLFTCYPEGPGVPHYEECTDCLSHIPHIETIPQILIGTTSDRQLQIDTFLKSHF